MFFVAIMAAAGYYVFNEELGGGAYVTVPDVTMRPASDAAGLLTQAGLELGSQRQAPDTRVPANYVIMQRPAAGKVVRTGRKVQLTLSAGTESLVPPELVGKDLQKAVEEIRLANFQMGNVARIPGTAARDVVLAQDPMPGHLVSNTTRFNLLVCEGPQTTNYIMPDLSGKPVQEALQILAQYKVKAIPNPVNMPDQPPDVVLDQEPAAGALLHEGDQIVYSVRPSSSITQRSVKVVYTVPNTMFDREIRLDVIDRNGTRTTMYPTERDYVDGEPPRHGAGVRIQLPTLSFVYKMTVEAYLDGQLARTMYYEGDAEPVVTDYKIQ